MFQQRVWILQRSNIELLRQCQRYISEQFSEKLSLAQNDLIEKIFYFSTLTTHRGFLETVDSLRRSLAEAQYDVSKLPGCVLADMEEDSLSQQQSESVSSKPVRQSAQVYRGQKVVAEQALLADDVTDKVQTSKRIYRGRIVES